MESVIKTTEQGQDKLVLRSSGTNNFFEPNTTASKYIPKLILK